MTRRRYDRATILRRAAGAGISLAALGLAPGLARARSLGTNLSLVAYSTPKPVMAKIIADFQASPAGQDVSVQPVLRRLDEPGEVRGRRACRPTSSSSRPATT